MRVLQSILRHNWLVALTCWIILFLLYLPAASAGWVQDITNLLGSYYHDSFGDYVNRSWSAVKSLYQFTQLVTWVGFRIMGVNVWAWHLLFVTLHALNVYLLYRLCNKLLRDSGISDAALIAFAGALLYAVAPWHAEVVVWEPSYHFMQASIFILLILILLVKYIHSQKAGYAFAAGIIFLLSVFALEQFLLTPLFVGAFVLFYRFGLGLDRRIIWKAARAFLLPQLIMIIAYFILFKALYSVQVPHLGDQLKPMSMGEFAIKPPEYVFHLLWGRALPGDFRLMVKNALRNYWVAGIFYVLIIALYAYALYRFRSMSATGKVASLLLVGVGISLSILLPLYFPDTGLSDRDRYMYLLSAFYFMILVVLASRIRSRALKLTLWTLCFAINIALSFQLIRYWQLSDRIVRQLQTNVRLQPGKTAILLNTPNTYKGIYMIGATATGEFRLLHNLLYAPPITDSLMDVMSYTMVSPDDGARVMVLNDSTVRLSLKHPDRNWHFTAYTLDELDNSVFKVSNLDTGRSYDLVLHKDPSTIQLLYQSGSRLKTVDMSSRKAVVQD